MVIKRELTRLASFYLKMINHVLTGGVLKNEQTKKNIYSFAIYKAIIQQEEVNEIEPSFSQDSIWDDPPTTQG